MNNYIRVLWEELQRYRKEIGKLPKGINWPESPYTTPDVSKLPSPYNCDEFAKWAKELRRIIVDRRGQLRRTTNIRNSRDYWAERFRNDTYSNWRLYGWQSRVDAHQKQRPLIDSFSVRVPITPDTVRQFKKGRLCIPNYLVYKETFVRTVDNIRVFRIAGVSALTKREFKNRYMGVFQYTDSGPKQECFVGKTQKSVIEEARRFAADIVSRKLGV